MKYITIISLLFQINTIINLYYKFKIEKFIYNKNHSTNFLPKNILVSIIFIGHIMYIFYKKRIKKYVYDYNNYNYYRYLNYIYTNTKNINNNKEYKNYIRLDRYFKLKRLQNDRKNKRGFFRFTY